MTHHPILSPPGTWAFALEMVCRDSADAEFTEDSARYRRASGLGLDTLLCHADRQWECCDNGRQWVAAIDSERIVLVQHVTAHDNLGQVVNTYEWSVEFYATEAAYEDRLDELATVPVVA